MRRYILAPEAAFDLIEIWRYLRSEASVHVANRVERVILQKIDFLSDTPGAGHWRRDLTDESVRFFAVYSYLIVYRPETRPLQVVAILHGKRDLERMLSRRI